MRSMALLLVGEEDLPHVGRGTARPPPPRRLMGAGRLPGSSVPPLAPYLWIASVSSLGRQPARTEGSPPHAHGTAAKEAGSHAGFSWTFSRMRRTTSSSVGYGERRIGFKGSGISSMR